jgi:hypothetical protein
MDDFPEDDFLDDLELPISPTASTFDALETPTPSQLSFAWSSDEIPILLYDDGYVDEASISRMSTATAGGNRESSMSLRGARMSYGPRDRMSMYRGSQASMVDLPGLNAVESSSTICSVGTFGPKMKKPSRLDETRISGHRSALPGPPSPTTVSPSPTSVPSTESEKRSSNISRRRRSSTQTLSGVFANPTVLVTTKRDSISVPNPRDSAQFSSLDSSETPYEVDLSVEIDDNSFTCRTPEKPKYRGQLHGFQLAIGTVNNTRNIFPERINLEPLLLFVFWKITRKERPHLNQLPHHVVESLTHTTP